ncbi:MAG: hypothetical protein H6701_05505 [Myxococcales bacterium]|nr:hypothetical protein [Myxococcales bacterium]
MFEGLRKRIEAAAEAPRSVETVAATAPTAGGVSVPLLGRKVTGPFLDVDETGAPMLELYELVPDFDALGRRCSRPCLIESVSHRLTVNDLLADDSGELGRRYYRVMVKGPDGQMIASNDVDLRHPDEVRRAGLRPNRRRRPDDEDAAPAAPAPTLGGLDTVQQLIREAVKAERERVEAERDRLVGAVEADRDAWKARAEAAEKKVEDLKETVHDLKLEALRAAVGQGKGMDIEGLVAHAEQIQRAQERLGLLAREEPAPAAPAVPRPSVGAQVASTVRDVQSAATAIVDILKLGGKGLSLARA